jgi:hypothetical protein
LTVRLIVCHRFYGCDTGCCGHALEVYGDQADWDHGFPHAEEWTFAHPYSKDDPLEWAKELVRDEFGEEHVADLDWENSFVTDD